MIEIQSPPATLAKDLHELNTRRPTHCELRLVSRSFERYYKPATEENTTSTKSLWDSSLCGRVLESFGISGRYAASLSKFECSWISGTFAASILQLECSWIFLTFAASSSFLSAYVK